MQMHTFTQQAFQHTQNNNTTPYKSLDSLLEKRIPQNNKNYTTFYKVNVEDTTIKITCFH